MSLPDQNPLDYVFKVTPGTSQKFFLIYDEFLDNDDTIDDLTSSFSSTPVGLTLVPELINQQPFTLKIAPNTAKIIRNGTVAGVNVSGFIDGTQYLLTHVMNSKNNRQVERTLTFNTVTTVP